VAKNRYPKFANSGDKISPCTIYASLSEAINIEARRSLSQFLPKLRWPIIHFLLMGKYLIDVFLSVKHPFLMMLTPILWPFLFHF